MHYGLPRGDITQSVLIVSALRGKRGEAGGVHVLLARFVVLSHLKTEYPHAVIIDEMLPALLSVSTNISPA